jgi:transcriptional regulator with XRE-family HTH domain
MTIGEKIKNLRINHSLTQEELAIAAKTTKQTIHKYETGIIENIPASKIKAIADKLKTTPSYLMGWEESTEQTKEDAVSDIFVKLRENNLFLTATQKLYNLNEQQLQAVITMLSTFEQN